MFVHKSRSMAEKATVVLAYRVSTNTGCHRLNTYSKDNERLAPVLGTEAERTFREVLLSTQELETHGQRNNHGPSASNITAVLQEQCMALQEWIIELLLKPHLPSSQYTFSVIPRRTSDVKKPQRFLISILNQYDGGKQAMRKEQIGQLKNPVEPPYTFSSYAAVTVGACF